MCIFKKIPIFFRKRQQQTPQIELLLHLTFIPQFALAENFYEMCKFPAEASPPSKILNYVDEIEGSPTAFQMGIIQIEI